MNTFVGQISGFLYVYLNYNYKNDRVISAAKSGLISISDRNSPEITEED